MKKSTPYLTFEKNCREAMTYYQSIFGGDLKLMLIRETPIAEHWPAEMQDKIMHAMLVSGEFTLAGSDLEGPDGRQQGNSIGIILDCKDQEEITHLFNSLSEGGSVFCPLGPSFWGSTFASVRDKFGINWAMNLEST